MADKSFGVKELNLLNASGTPTVTSPNNLNLNANTVAISTSCTIGNNLTVTGGTSLSNLLVSGITTFTAGNTVDVRGNFTVSGISTIPQPADSNPMANWTITNNSASAYRFTGPGQSGTEDNPNIYLVRGHRYIFKHNATSSHPIQIRFANGGTAYTDGVTYSDTSNNRTTDGNNLIFNVQHDAPAQLFYQCTSHGGMVGNIYIVGGPQVISGVVTATTFVGNLTGNVTGTASANAVLTGSTNNTLVTVTGANAITGESTLTFNGADLEIQPAAAQPALFIGDSNRTGAGQGLVHFRGNWNGTTVARITFDTGDDTTNKDDGIIRFDTSSTGSLVERVRIDRSGNLGIGNVSSPDDKVEIRTSTNDQGVLIKSTGSSSNAIKFDANRSGANQGIGNIKGRWNGTTVAQIYMNTGDDTTDKNDGYIIFGTESAASNGNVNATERLRITSGGNVNIGDNFGQTTYKTQIESTDQNVLRLVTDSDNADGVELVLRKDSASPADNDNIGNIYFQGNDDSGAATFYASMEAYSSDVSNNSEDGYIRFRTRNNGSMGERVRIDSGGNLNVTGVGTFSGSVTVGYDTTYSPIQQAANTWFYTRADQASSVSGSNIQNLATGSIAISETIPISNMTRQSDAGAHSFYNSSATSGSVTRNMSSGNPFHPKAHGLTMGTMFRAHTSGNNGSGVIHYGWTPTSHHFFVRYKYNSVGLNIGVDTDGSDVWTTAYQNDLVSDNNWYFFVIAVERNGTLMTSLNGAPLTPIRMLGTAPTPTDARFGLAGDGYTDNDSRHRYATAFWHKGVISNELIAQEYAWLKTIWTGASLP